MDQPPPNITPVWLLSVVAAGLWMFLAVWGSAIARWRRGQPLLPYQPRRPVPWRGVDLLILLVVFLFGGEALGLLAEPILGPEAVEPPLAYDLDEASAAHATAKLVKQADPWVLVLCVISVGVVAPIVEEFLFRIVLQGWLEAAQRRLRPKMPTLGRLVPGAAGPILLTSLLFGRMHFRVGQPPMDTSFYVYQMIGTSVVGLLVLGAAIALLRFRAGATAADLGWVPKRLLHDVWLGLVAFAGLALPVYLLQVLLASLLTKSVAPDPIVLFVFAVALGVLAYRTHRVAPAIVVHMVLNLTSLTLLYVAARQGAVP
jgi:membrane protease YdiL (CAAX protease family)